MATEAFLKIVMEKVASLITEEIGLIVGAQTEMKKLASNFTAIQAVLEDAQLNHRDNRQIQDWLKKLTDAAYEIDDILDECATNFSRSKALQHSRFSIGEILFRRNIGMKIKQATERLDKIAEERERYSLRSLVVQNSSKELGARETSSHLNEIDHIYGREDDKQKIVDILVNQAMSNQKISVLPIIGIGGLGKTTLAQLVLKDPRVVEHFGLRLWVCVSENFDLNRLIKAIIESGSESTRKGSASDLTTLEGLQSRLESLLGQKKYLLVLDDVWNEDQQEWSRLRNALSCGSTGSSIIVTTRVPKVAEITGTLPSYHLDELSEEHCWMLLKHRAFRGCDEEEQYPNLVAIGKQIVKKCKGVPLAAATLGGILHFKGKTEKEWVGVKESELWNLKQGKTDILPVLKLSYHNLPLELRQCFTYCAIFPKDFTISKQELVRLWVAHGYISSQEKLEAEDVGGYISSQEKLEAEDVGEQILNELILRSLLQISKRNDSSLTMHDLHHDLAQSIMETCTVFPGTQLRRISAGVSGSKIREVNLSKIYRAIPTKDITSILKDYHCLRVLRGDFFLTFLPSAIGSLIHLRSLDLSYSHITYLPNSICNLWNLHELNLNWCYGLKGFPKKMRYLRNLRHLHIEGCSSLVGTPSRVGELTFLRTLSMFVVNYKKGHRLEELEHLNLGGRLEIRRADRVKSRGDAEKANLVEKCNLRDLRIYWEDLENGSQEKDEMVLDALKPHSDLECLCLFGFSGRHLASWMKRSSVPKLVKIALKCCRNFADLSHVEVLTQLEYLELDEVSIEYLGRQGGNALNSSHFPALKEVKLCNLSNLKGFFEEEVVCQQACPKLQRLTVERCPCLVDLSHMEELTHLEYLKLDEVSIEYLGFQGGNALNSSHFPALKEVELRNLSNLKGFFKEEQVCQQACPKLQRLTVKGCPCLADLSHVEVLTHLEYLELDDLSIEYLGRQGGNALNSSHFPALKELRLHNLGNLKGLFKEEEVMCHQQACPKLQQLSVGRCPCLVLPPLNTLEELRMYGENEQCIPPTDGLRGLNSLRGLEIGGSETLRCLPPKSWLCHNNSTLQSIMIHNCREFVDMPEEIKHLHSLKKISLISLPKMESIPDAIKHVHSLEALSLMDLPSLTSLPDWLGEVASLPEHGMKNLQSLRIFGCPKLKRR